MTNIFGGPFPYHSTLVEAVKGQTTTHLMARSVYKYLAV